MKKALAPLALPALLVGMGLFAAPSLAAPPAASGGGLAAAVTYTYDVSGRLTGADLGGGTKVLYTYDDAGNLLTRRIVTSVGDPSGDSVVDVFDVVVLSNFIVGNVQPGTPPFLGSATSVNLNPSQGPAVDVFDLLILMNYIVGNYTSIPI